MRLKNALSIQPIGDVDGCGEGRLSVAERYW
jgi:hypothetical protein